jgi:5-methylcytosine-specific restriction endonuclease McrA
MKRAAADHPKIQRLQRRLSLTRFQAMGLLEAVWHFTGRYAPEGDIGRWADEEIAAWIEWTDAPEGLVEALVVCGWLDRDTTHRLLVHDWAEHADDPSRRDYNPSKKARRRARVRAAGGDIRPETRRLILERDGFQCKRCAATEDLTLDHIIPISRGGTNALENLRCLCRRCNSSKRDRLEVQHG